MTTTEYDRRFGGAFFCFLRGLGHRRRIVDDRSGADGHGYALTAHKSQGSEWDEVLLLLPDSPSPLLTRELLYSAVSRARRSVVLCGPREMLDLAIATQESRDSGVASRLAARLGPTA